MDRVFLFYFFFFFFFQAEDGIRDGHVTGVQTCALPISPKALLRPVRTRIGLNSAFGVFGPGYRANATIGRALRLLMINVGGARPGEISMSTFGHPGRYTYCIAENEEASPWPPFHASRGFPAEVSTVTLFAGEGPHGISVGSRTGAVP